MPVDRGGTGEEKLAPSLEPPGVGRHGHSAHRADLNDAIAADHHRLMLGDAVGIHRNNRDVHEGILAIEGTMNTGLVFRHAGGTLYGATPRYDGPVGHSRARQLEG